MGTIFGGIDVARDLWATGNIWGRRLIGAHVLWIMGVVVFAALPFEPLLWLLFAALLASLVMALLVSPALLSMVAVAPTSPSGAHTNAWNESVLTARKLIRFGMVVYGLEFLVWTACYIVPMSADRRVSLIIAALAVAFVLIINSTSAPLIDWNKWAGRIAFGIAVAVVIAMAILLLGGWDNVTRDAGGAVRTTQQNASSTSAANRSAPAAKAAIQVVERCGESGGYNTPFPPGVRAIKFTAPADCWTQWMAVPAGTYQVTINGPVWGEAAKATMPAAKKKEWSRQIRNGEELVFDEAMILQFRSVNLNSGVEVTLKMK